MPPPALLAEYEQIFPGAAELFFLAMDRQSRHRQQIENRVIDASVANERVGMVLAFILAVLLTGCGTFLIFRDKDPQGLSVIAGTLVALCGVFVYNRVRERRPPARHEPESLASAD